MSKRKIIIANTNPEFQFIIDELKRDYLVKVITTTKALSPSNVYDFGPDWIIFTHWSNLVPHVIHEKYRCILFHMTDLPFGRGGSPLQNLIVGGYRTTKISALKMSEELDAGDIYLKNDLTLEGSAREIFNRAANVILHMIRQIVENDITPIPQEGTVVQFKRRKPSDGNMKNLKSLEEVYDYIRMLDADNYPPAFLETESLKIEFIQANKTDKEVLANVRITRK